MRLLHLLKSLSSLAALLKSTRDGIVWPIMGHIRDSGSYWLVHILIDNERLIQWQTSQQER